MKLEGSEEINDAISAMNSIKLLKICGMLLSQPKETTLHGLRWNSSPVSPVVMEDHIAWTQVEQFTSKSSCNVLGFFAEVWNLYTQW